MHMHPCRSTLDVLDKLLEFSFFTLDWIKLLLTNVELMLINYVHDIRRLQTYIFIVCTFMFKEVLHTFILKDLCNMHEKCLTGVQGQVLKSNFYLQTMECLKRECTMSRF